MPRPIADLISAVSAEKVILDKVIEILNHKGPDLVVDGLTELDEPDLAAYNADETHDVELLAGQILTRIYGRLQALATEMTGPPA